MGILKKRKILTMTETFLSKIPFKKLLEVSEIKSYRDSAVSRHKLVMSVFPQLAGESARKKLGVLFRLEKSIRGSFFIVQSKVAPANIPGIETLAKNEEVSLHLGDQIRFRVTVSPIKRVGSKEVLITDYDEIEEWITQKLSSALSDVVVVNQKDERVARDKGRNFVKLVQIDGVASVSDVLKLSELIESGVGRNKNYGAGLLSVSRIG